MKIRLFSILLFIVMIASLLGATMLSDPANAADGQKWYINNDSGSGDAYGDLTTSPNTPVSDQYTYSRGFDYGLISYTPVTFPSGDWKVHFVIRTPITRNVTFGIKKQDVATGWYQQIIASQQVNLDIDTTGTTVVDLTFPLDGFTLGANGYLFMYWASGSSDTMYIQYGGANCYLQTPAGSPEIACPPYSTGTTIGSLQATSAVLSTTIPYLGSCSEATVKFRVARNDGNGSYFFDASPSPVTAGGTTVTATATGLPASTGFYFYPIISFDGHSTNGGTQNFSTPAATPTYTLTTGVSPSGSGTVTRNPDQAVYDSGTSVSITAEPAANYQFTGWSGDTSSMADRYSPTTTIIMNGNKTATANFMLKGLEWLQQIGDESNTFESRGIAVDSTGNPCMLGMSNAALPGHNFQGGGTDEFLIKYTPYGQIIWAIEVGNITEKPSGIAVGGDDVVYVTGTSSTDQWFSTGKDAYIRQYASNGIINWLKPVGTTGEDWGRGVSADAENNVYIIGDTNGDIDGEGSDVSAGGSDVFVAKYNNSGNAVWAHQVGSGGDDTCSAVAVDGDGNVYIAGTVNGAIEGQTATGGSDVFLRKYSSTGEVLWTRQFGTDASDVAGRLAVDQGHVYISGSTDGALEGENTSASADVFLRKYDSDGTVVWTRQIGTGGQESAGGLTVDGYHNVFVGGSTGGTFPGQASSGSNDAFFVKYNSLGDQVWLKQYGSSADDEVSGLAHSSNSLYITGNAGGALPGLSGLNGNDAFIIKFTETPCTLTMDKDGNGTVTPEASDHQYTEGTVVDINAVPDAGWQFAGWSGDVAEASNPGTTVTMDADKTVTANFTGATQPAVSLLAQQAGDIGSTTATLRGRLDSMGDAESVNVFFTFWDQAMPAMQMTAPIPPIPLVAPADFTVEITSGLIPGHTYVYKANAVAPGIGTDESDTDTFTWNATSGSEAVRNGNFSAGLNQWVVNPELPADWEPVTEGVLSLSPPVPEFYNTVVYQNLNVTGIAGKEFTLALDLAKISMIDYGKTLAAYLVWVDTSDMFHKTLLLNPDNSTVPLDSFARLSGTFTAPPEADKLVKLVIAKEGWGELNVDNISLTAEGITVGAVPEITSISPTGGDYGTAVTLTGSNFGDAAGEITIGGSSQGIVIDNWSQTSIEITVQEPARSGRVCVAVDFTESNIDHQFNVTSPNFTVDMISDSVTAVKGETAFFPIRVDFHNGFTTGGISFMLHEGPSDAASFSPATLTIPGGTLLRIETGSLEAGNHHLIIQSLEDSSFARFADAHLNVVETGEIVFNSGEDVITSYNAGVQGQIYIYAQGKDTLGNPLPGTNPLILSSSNPSVLGVYPNNFAGYDIYALQNGSANLVAVSPDGYTESLPVTVAFPDSPRVNTISLNPSTITNKYTGDIDFYASATESVSYGYEGLLATTNNIDWSQDNLSAYGAYKIDYTGGPPELGTYLFHASTKDSQTAAMMVTPLTIINDPTYSAMQGAVIPLDSSVPVHILGSFNLEFYQNGTLQHTISHWQMHHFGLASFTIGAIPPGTYKVKLVPGAGVLSQWYPNASDMSGASELTFTAGQVTGDIFFFVKPAPVPDYITITPANPSVAVGETQAFNAQAYDSAGNPINGLTYFWSCTDSAAGSIDASGLFTAGTTPGIYSNVIQASAGNVTGTASVTVIPASLPPASVALGSSKNPSDFGDPVIFTAAVSGASGIPTGTVVFAIDGVPQVPPVTLDGAGTALFSISTLAVGNHNITAAYSGDSHYAASASNILVQAVLEPDPLPSYKLTINIIGQGTTDPVPSPDLSFPENTSVIITANPNPGWRFSHWDGEAVQNLSPSMLTASPLTLTMDGDKTLDVYFAPEGITLIGSLIKNPGPLLGQQVTLSGVYRGWESGHGSPPVTRSDWVLQDASGSIYITGSTMGKRHPDNIGDELTVTGIVRVKGNQVYIEIPRN